MRLGKDLVNKPIYSIGDGRSLGVVKDIYLDNDLIQITGIYTGQEGVLRRKSFLIPRPSVVLFGIDAILVKNADVVVEETAVEESANWVRLSKLRGREVDTPNGTKVAAVGDVIIAEEGDLVGLALSKVFVEGPIAEKGAIARAALIDTGSQDGIITLDLTKAETTDLAPATSEPDTSAPHPSPEKAATTLPDEEV
ncbi:MAG: hypothetical protein GY796_15930 [Chloroflexi bacterium]|nr:hypothetical protein [Chloroflexota bacterium]